MDSLTIVSGDDPLLDWAWADAPLEMGLSGDRAVVAPFPGGALVAAMDGLGHGREAREAAEEAARILEAHPTSPVLDLIHQCHAALRGTRGVVMALVSLNADASTLTWAGIGNVDAVLLREDTTAAVPIEALLNRGGVVGFQLPAIRASVLPLRHGDTLFLATDGVSTRFTTRLRFAGSAGDLASSLLDEFATGADDALVMVVRYRGGQR